nr:hypothetical protein [Thermosinus carboxydivorans]
MAISLDEFLALDKQRRELLVEVEGLKNNAIRCRRKSAAAKRMANQPTTLLPKCAWSATASALLTAGCARWKQI